MSGVSVFVTANEGKKFLLEIEKNGLNLTCLNLTYRFHH
jgi:hypothetical protein